MQHPTIPARYRVNDRIGGSLVTNIYYLHESDSIAVFCDDFIVRMWGESGLVTILAAGIAVVIDQTIIQNMIATQRALRPSRKVVQ